jgi:hypothetical protein
MQPLPNLVPGVRSPRRLLWPKNWLSRYAASRQPNRGGLMDANGVMRGIRILTHSARMPSLKMSPGVFGAQRSSTDRLSLTDGGHQACCSRCYSLQRPAVLGKVVTNSEQSGITMSVPVRQARKLVLPSGLPTGGIATGSYKATSVSWANTFQRTKRDVRAILGSEGRSWSRSDGTGYRCLG